MEAHGARACSSTCRDDTAMTPQRHIAWVLCAARVPTLSEPARSHAQVLVPSSRVRIECDRVGAGTLLRHRCAAVMRAAARGLTDHSRYRARPGRPTPRDGVAPPPPCFFVEAPREKTDSTDSKTSRRELRCSAPIPARVCPLSSRRWRGSPHARARANASSRTHRPRVLPQTAVLLALARTTPRLTISSLRAVFSAVIRRAEVNS